MTVENYLKDKLIRLPIQIILKDDIIIYIQKFLFTTLKFDM